MDIVKTKDRLWLTLHGANCTWHAMAVYYFIFKGRGIARAMSHYPLKTTSARATDFAMDMLKFLGLLNTALVIYSILKLLKHLQKMKRNDKSRLNGNNEILSEEIQYLIVMAAANMSQFVGDIRFILQKKHKPAFIRTITAGDGLFAFINLLLALKLATKKKNLVVEL